MGTLKAVTSTNQQYVKYTYTYNGTVYTGIHRFETKAGTQSIMPAIAYENFKYLSNMNPATVAAENVICKTNGFIQTYGTNRFYGVFYQGQGHTMYVDGIEYSKPESVYSGNLAFTEHFYPSFCVKKDGTATIRWFENPTQIAEAAKFCQCIFGSYHPLIYDNKNVMTTRVLDKYDNVLICDPSNLKGGSRRFRGGEANIDGREKRTLLGHKSGSSGIYIMVCVDTGMPLIAAASMMKDFGCDYAVNMDGGLPSEMRVKKGYGAEGKVR